MLEQIRNHISITIGIFFCRSPDAFQAVPHRGFIGQKDNLPSDADLFSGTVFYSRKNLHQPLINPVGTDPVGIPDCDAYVIPIPYYDKNPDGSFKESLFQAIYAAKHFLFLRIPHLVSSAASCHPSHQEFAMSLGENIEKLEREGHPVVPCLEEYHLSILFLFFRHFYSLNPFLSWGWRGRGIL